MQIFLENKHPVWTKAQIYTGSSGSIDRGRSDFLFADVSPTAAVSIFRAEFIVNVAVFDIKRPNYCAVRQIECQDFDLRFSAQQQFSEVELCRSQKTLLKSCALRELVRDIVSWFPNELFFQLLMRGAWGL